MSMLDNATTQKIQADTVLFRYTFDHGTYGAEFAYVPLSPDLQRLIFHACGSVIAAKIHEFDHTVAVILYDWQTRVAYSTPVEVQRAVHMIKMACMDPKHHQLFDSDCLMQTADMKLVKPLVCVYPEASILDEVILSVTISDEERMYVLDCVSTELSQLKELFGVADPRRLERFARYNDNAAILFKAPENDDLQSIVTRGLALVELGMMDELTTALLLWCEGLSADAYGQRFHSCPPSGSGTMVVIEISRICSTVLEIEQTSPLPHAYEGDLQYAFRLVGAAPTDELQTWLLTEVQQWAANASRNGKFLQPAGSLDQRLYICCVEILGLSRWLPPHTTITGSLRILFALLRTQCALCGAGSTLQSCSRCGVVRYCSRTHQLTSWSEKHKEQCAFIRTLSCMWKFSNYTRS